MPMLFFIRCLLMPAVVAARYTCGTRASGPVTVLSLAAIVSVLFGLNGGPMARDEINWESIYLGLSLWLFAGIWTYIATKNLETCKLPKQKKN